VLLSTALVPVGLTVGVIGVLFVIDVAFADVSEAAYNVAYAVAFVSAVAISVGAGLRRRQPKRLLPVFAFASLAVTFWLNMWVIMAIWLLAPQPTWYCC
jgi:hypothetical protein